MFEAWVSLDRCVTSNERSGENGSTLLHLSIIQQANRVLIYLLYIVIIWDWIRQRRIENKDFTYKIFQTFEEVINYRNKSDRTPLLCASKNDNYEAFRLLFQIGGSIHVVCLKFNNCLHYAMMNQNEHLIKFILSIDAESDVLLWEVNIRA